MRNKVREITHLKENFLKNFKDKMLFCKLRKKLENKFVLQYLSFHYANINSSHNYFFSFIY